MFSPSFLKIIFIVFVQILVALVGKKKTFFDCLGNKIKSCNMKLTKKYGNFFNQHCFFFFFFFFFW